MAEESDNDDKTEDASQRKLDRAIEQGDVVKSMEVSTFFLLGATLIMVAFMSGPAARNLATPFTVLLGQAEQFSLDGAMLKQLAWASAKVFALTVLIPALVLALAVIAGNMIQHRLVFSAESLKPKLSKVSPIAGFKRLFGLDAWVNFIKGLTKLTAVAAAIGAVLWPLRDRLDTMVAADVVALMPMMQDLTVKMLIVVVIIMALIAGADYLWQRQRWLTRQKMTKQEVKDEYKETEGNPEVKAKIKQLRSQ
ncbi:MAG: EscU/YscU/HrcU family type III secretion system export apparatus switch protein, partial [Tabrizicola sp.]|nr:EscU/YscU/HrcU family type III secretion system export apparatus switch protein [Tabrizicola sp.]